MKEMIGSVGGLLRVFQSREFRSVFTRLLLPISGLCVIGLIFLPERVTAQAPSLSLESEGFGNDGFSVVIRGEDGQQVQVEVTEDLANWRPLLDSTTLEGGSARVVDIEALVQPIRFYRARLIGGEGPDPGEGVAPSIFPSELVLLAGDTIPLRLNGVEGVAAEWEFQVNGIPGGNPEIGEIVVSESDPTLVFFSAPELPPTTPTIVRGRHLTRTDLDFSATLDVRPVVGELEIVPGTAELVVGDAITFQAGIRLVGLGYIPLNRGFWSINGTVGGVPGLGIIDNNGDYLAPAVLPSDLPATIEVGFALGETAAVLASATVTLVDFEVSPRVFRALDIGSTSPISAQIVRSDGTSSAVPVSGLRFASSFPAAAFVNPAGAIEIGTEAGIATIEVTETTRGQQGIITVASEPHAFFHTPAFELLSQDDAFLGRRNGPNLDFQSIEVTRPGVILDLTPRMFFQKSPFTVIGQDPEEIIDVETHPNMLISGDGNQVVDFDGLAPGAPSVGFRAAGTTAVVERTSAVVEVGDVPGTGHVVFSYDDGLQQREQRMQITFSRLDLSVDAPQQLYISEWLNLNVAVSNPNPVSDFIGRTPILISLKSNESVLDPVDRETFFVTGDRLMEEVTEFRTDIETAPNTINTGLGSNASRSVSVAISPRRAGPVTFVVRVLNDPGIPPQEVTVEFLEPTLRVNTPWPAGGVRVGYGAIDGSRIVQNSYVDFAVGEGADPADFPADLLGTAYSSIDPLVWRITRPGGEEVVVPLNPRNVALPFEFTGTFDALGEYVIRKGFRDRPEIRTAAKTVEVVAATEFGALSESLDVEDAPIPTSNQFASFQILQAPRNAWVPGGRTPLSIQFYNADKEASFVGLVETIDGEPRTFSYMTLDHEDYGVSLGFADPAPGSNLVGYVDDRVFPATGQMDVEIGVSTVVPLAGEGADDIFILVPSQSIRRGLFDLDENVDVISHSGTAERDSSILGGARVLAPGLGRARFQDERDESFIRQGVRIPGSGLILQPNRIPVASQRVRDAVAAGILPTGADNGKIVIQGTQGFADSLRAGAPTFELGTGVELVTMEIDLAREALIVELATELPSSLRSRDFSRGDFRPRDIKITFADGVVWVGNLSLYATELSPQFAGEPDLPMNARLGPNAPVASTRFGVLNLGIPAPSTLSLRPSLAPCWDRNGNGVADPDEDQNGDGLFDERDCLNVVNFRSAPVMQPMIGFERIRDPLGGAPRVESFIQTVPAFIGSINVYGNPIDERRLLMGDVLSDRGEPDGLPDFVSPSVGAEQLVVGWQGNIADIITFTVYNVTAEITEDLQERGFDFTEVGELAINEVYDRYSTFSPGAGLSLDAILDDRVPPSASVWVDHEANGSDLDANNDVLFGEVPTQDYFAGVLDQLYQQKRIGQGTFVQSFVNLLSDAELADPVNLRVRPYRPLRQRPVTGVDRRLFGIDLDAVFYDAATFRGGADDPPNGGTLLAVPVIEQLVPMPPVTTMNLVPRFGGTSGGYFDVSAGAVGRYRVDSKLPGVDFPGVHAGYLIEGTPGDLRDPRIDTEEDDIRDVLIRRHLDIADPEHGGIRQEQPLFGGRQKRRVLTFSQNEDGKDPLLTGLREDFRFEITTDPPALEPRNPDAFQFRAALQVRERPSVGADPYDLIVSTQSTGNEGILKAAVDAAVDLAVDVAGTVVLNFFSGGGYSTACPDQTVGSAIKGAVSTFVLDVADEELLEPYVDEGPRKIINLTGEFLLKGLQTEPQGIASLDISNIVPRFEDQIMMIGGRRVKTGTNVRLTRPKILDFCELARFPFEVLKDEIRDTYSAESFGGLGSSEAVGIKSMGLAIPVDAQLDQGGTYSVLFNVARKIEIQPKEPNAVPLAVLPYAEVFSDGYPYPDEVSDFDLTVRLLEASQPTNPDDEQRAAALMILRVLRGDGLIRDVERIVVEQQLILPPPSESVYERYTLRIGNMPALSTVVAPRSMVDDQAFTDGVVSEFAVKPGETRIPVAVSAVATASRSNENANAAASVRSESLEMILRNAVLMP